MPNVVVFLRVLRFPPTGKVDRVARNYGPTVIGSRCCGDAAPVAKLNKIEDICDVDLYKCRCFAHCSGVFFP